jgi:hypothetical protein
MDRVVDMREPQVEPTVDPNVDNIDGFDDGALLDSFFIPEPIDDNFYEGFGMSSDSESDDEEYQPFPSSGLHRSTHHLPRVPQASQEPHVIDTSPEVLLNNGGSAPPETRSMSSSPFAMSSAVIEVPDVLQEASSWTSRLSPCCYTEFQELICCMLQILLGLPFPGTIHS